MKNPSQLDQLTESLLNSHNQRTADSTSGYALKQRVLEALNLLRNAMYPEIFATDAIPEEELSAYIRSCLRRSSDCFLTLFEEVLKDAGRAKETRDTFFSRIPELSRIIGTDIEAAYYGDPAAKSLVEIMVAYPAFEAISIYRIAHTLYQLQVPMIPRIMTEYAHKNTGIDIHPGATIGESFFIDHGTGVVIGETCTIGHHVKLYQGVTLGAKSFELDENGNPVKGIKRHPDIGNHVIIYAGATILGGNTSVGDDSVIGGNVWLTTSVPAGSKVYNKLA